MSVFGVVLLAIAFICFVAGINEKTERQSDAMFLASVLLVIAAGVWR